AQELAVLAVDLEACRRVLHADVDLAGRTDCDIAVLVAKLWAALRQLQPVGDDGIRVGRPHCREQKGDRHAGEKELLHGRSIPFVRITESFAGFIRNETNSCAAVPWVFALTPAVITTNVCTSAGNTPPSCAPFTGRISLIGRTAMSAVPPVTLVFTSSPDFAS